MSAPKPKPLTWKPEHFLYNIYCDDMVKVWGYAYGQRIPDKRCKSGYRLVTTKSRIKIVK